MPDLDILNQMIKDSARVRIESRHQKPIVVLEEPQAKKCSVEIRGLPDDVVIIKADAFESPFSVFTCKKGECKRADYIVVADTGRKKVIIFIEMKKTKKSKQDIEKQLSGAKCFLAYCKEIGISFWENSNFLSGYKYRFVSIGHISISKRKTRIERKSGIHDEPGKMMKVDWPSHLQFNHLAGH